MKRQSAAETTDRPSCHPLSHYRPVRFTENNNHYISGNVFVCAACMKDKDAIPTIPIPTIKEYTNVDRI